MASFLARRRAVADVASGSNACATRPRFRDGKERGILVVDGWPWAWTTAPDDGVLRLLCLRVARTRYRSAKPAARSDKKPGIAAAEVQTFTDGTVEVGFQPLQKLRNFHARCLNSVGGQHGCFIDDLLLAAPTLMFGRSRFHDGTDAAIWLALVFR